MTVVSKENYTWLQKYVYDHSGIVLDDGKQYLLDTRLSPILKDRGLTDINSLCALLRATAPEQALRKDVLEAMTTNETLFFRDNGVFECLRDHVLPEIVESRKATRTLRLWSAAASTGQEIYSLAMMLLTTAGLSDWTLKLHATDYSEQVLEKAQSGRFLQIEVNRGLPAAMLVRYFTRHGREWEIKPEIRRMVRFERFDLRAPMHGLGPYDLVLCRNVLIYFDVKTKQSILNQIALTMPKGGWLVLGTAETLFHIDCPFERSQVGSCVFYRRV